MSTISLRKCLCTALVVASAQAGAVQYPTAPTAEGAVINADSVVIAVPTGERLVEERRFAQYPGMTASPVLARNVAFAEVDVIEVLGGAAQARQRIWVATDRPLPRDVPVVLPLLFRVDPTRLLADSAAQEYSLAFDVALDGSTEDARSGARIFVLLVRSALIDEVPTQPDPAQP